VMCARVGHPSASQLHGTTSSKIFRERIYVSSTWHC
jgi:hypothetical protein